MTEIHWGLLRVRPRQKTVISATMGISVCEKTTHVTGLASSCVIPAPQPSTRVILAPPGR
eukprot:784835-Prorocentrum_minimum.AAC.1